MPSPTGTLRGRDPLRPTRLADFTGQPEVVAQLRVMLDAALARGQLAPHLLFSGPPGLGKTSLARLVGRELGVDVVATSGPALDKPGDLAGLLSGADGPTVVFIDEIHRMPRKVEELLYSAMEDRVLDIRLGEGDAARVVQIELAPLVLIGATTQQGLVSAPLRDRFGHVFRLTLYTDQALTDIAAASQQRLGGTISPDAAAAIAQRSRGTPRVALQLLDRVRDHAQVSGVDHIDRDVVGRACATFGVDPIGLDSLGQAILTALCTSFGGGPVGLSTLAAAVGEQPTTVADAYEPFLLRRGLLVRTPRGRVATAASFEHLGLDVPDSTTSTGQLQFDSDDVVF